MSFSCAGQAGEAMNVSLNTRCSSDSLSATNRSGMLLL